MKKLYVFFTIAGGTFLFGSLLASFITSDTLYFICGYPAAAVSLLFAYLFKMQGE